MGRTGFEKLRVYSLAEQIGDLAWGVVKSWDRFSQDTLGKQLVNAADSIAANTISLRARGAEVLRTTADLRESRGDHCSN
jgi:hypothetical protein